MVRLYGLNDSREYIVSTAKLEVLVFEFGVLFDNYGGEWGYINSLEVGAKPVQAIDFIAYLY